MMKWRSRIVNKALLAVPIAAAAVIAAYAISPYFTGSTINEALPEGAILSDSHHPDTETGLKPKTADTETSEETGAMPAESKSVMIKDGVIMEVNRGGDGDPGSDEAGIFSRVIPRVVDDKGGDGDPGSDEAGIAPGDEVTTHDSTDISVQKPAPTTHAGTFIGVGDGIHDAQGDAYTITLKDGGRVLRLENFESTNGPGLHVYLSADKAATDYIDLGDLKANKGNQNYEIPQHADLSTYNKVLIWCEPFGVLFGSAEIVPQ